MEKNHGRVPFWWALPSLLLVFSSVDGATNKIHVEVVPFAGYQFGGELAIDPNASGSQKELDIQEAGNYGFFITVPVGGKGGAVGAMYLRQATELDSDPFSSSGEVDLRVEYYHVEGLWLFKPGLIRPMVAASVGATRFEAPGFGADTRLSGSIAGGVQIRPLKHLGFRFEGRWYGTLVDREEERFCADDDDDSCYQYQNSTVQNQWDIKGGLVIAF